MGRGAWGNFKFQSEDVVFRDSYRLVTVAYPGILFGGGGVSTNSVEDRENGDLGVVAP